jgi:Ca2+-transporting ATPase
LVCAVGVRTRWFIEHPVEDLEDDNEDTPLTIKLKNLAGVIEGYAHIAAFLICSTLLLFLVCNILFNGSAELLSQGTLQKLIRAFTTGVAIIIVSVPEGLGLAVSISMAFSISQMKNHKLLVKKMAATENLAYTNIICTGKTGTITTGEMAVRQFFIGAQSQDFDPARVDLMRGT